MAFVNEPGRTRDAAMVDFTTQSNNTLSWQSVFWAVVPIALNSMSQPSGRILGYPRTYNFALRCSPVVCAASALDSLAQLAVFTIRERSLSTALQKSIDRRFEDTHGDEDGSFQSLRENTIFRIVLFLFGAVPQLIKVYASSGVPWTQTLGTAYLAPFILDELFLLAAPKQREQQRGDHSDNATVDSTPRENSGGPPIYEVFTTATLWASVGLASAVLLLVSARLAEPTSSNPVLPQIVEISVVLAGWTYWFTRPDSEFFTDLFAASITTTFTPSFSKSSSGSIHIQVLGINRTMCLLNVALATMLLVFKVLIDKEVKIGSAPYAKYARWGLGVYYTTLNTLAALLYYRFVYDPTSTYKPQWTNGFG